MALLRMMPIALAACGHAGAEPPVEQPVTSGIAAPAEWQALPEVARAAAAAAKGPGVAVDGVEAWGERSRGCYAVWIAMHGDGASATAVLAGLASEGLTTRDVVTPPAPQDGLVTLAFSKGSYEGRLRARVAAGKVTALACFANDREPRSCDASCTALLGGIP
ncbi:MAG TPA: hypothetical protein VM513_07845 [Kofleriaceae bacterium]|nr:hypothetical protein [Kofleriaceae bacterium]